jgi:hypothetical protein
MGLQPTRANENDPRRHPRESGGPFSVRNTMDSRLRGNDVIFRRVSLGLWPTLANENQRRPRESGDPLSAQWIPAYAGMTRRA